jgi:hypothetical protein
MPLSLKRKLMLQLDHAFLPLGFTRVSDNFYGHRYDRSFTGGRRSIAINWHVRKPDLVLDAAYASVTIDEVQRIVARYEEKNELATASDVAWRTTVGRRLESGDLVRTLTRRWAVSKDDDCIRVAANFASETLRGAESFWNTVDTPERVLAKLAADPIEVRDYAAPDYSAAERAIVLCKLLYGTENSRNFARDRLESLSGPSRGELSAWLSRASAWFEDDSS